ncbi:hypothetical protein B0A49_02075 [Cryomyces minteri]|uniref:Eukaryotic mitochondrial regulator protein-domain-containing protein n=1 Tax=Cryomyces minteri TaxID=331657 RepID=A0A4U0XQY8_9PEZI|nr:hypothetical protein B0A49_02075 [Cryomyces minteri]
MWAWLNGPGRVFHQPLPQSTNYLGAYDKSGRLIRGTTRARKSDEDKSAQAKDGEEDDDALTELEKKPQENNEDENSLPPETLEDLRPFPLNREFRSQPVLSVELRDAIYNRVVRDGLSVKAVSAEFRVEMARVGAVVRLKAVEEQWIKENKRLATPYQRAVLDMLPRTPYVPEKPVVHESINDLPVHQATRQQIFYPASESRAFTREDAGKVFDATLLPADARIPHPELIEQEKWRLAGMPKAEREAMQAELDRKAAQRKAELERRRKHKEDTEFKTVPGRRWDFKFQDINANAVGQDERSLKGVGWRYGFPHEDRKRGQIKIPRNVN